VAGFDVLRERRQVQRRIGVTGQYAAVDELLTGRENRPARDQVAAAIMARLIELPRRAVVCAEDETHLHLLPHVRASWTLRGGLHRALGMLAGIDQDTSERGQSGKRDQHEIDGYRPWPGQARRVATCGTPRYEERIPAVGPGRQVRRIGDLADCEYLPQQGAANALPGSSDAAERDSGDTAAIPNDKGCHARQAHPVCYGSHY
jgi:hypothetical protein